MRPELDRAASDLILAIEGIRVDLDRLEFIRALRPLVEAHTEAIDQLARGARSSSSREPREGRVEPSTEGNGTEGLTSSSCLQEAPAADSSRATPPPAMQGSLFG